MNSGLFAKTVSGCRRKSTISYLRAPYIIPQSHRIERPQSLAQSPEAVPVDIALNFITHWPSDNPADGDLTPFWRLRYLMTFSELGTVPPVL